MKSKENMADEAPGLSAPLNGRKIYFVRHGKTDWNNQFRYQGVTDIPLCEEGREQARLVGLRLAGAELGAIVSSPLSRAFETAENIAAHHPNIKIERLPELTEVNFGEWEGLTVPQIKKNFGEEMFHKWRSNQLHVTAPGGEEMEALYDRSSRAAAALLARSEKNIVVVGHGAMFRALLLPLLGLPRSNIFWKARIDNCSISAVGVEAGGAVTLAFLNDIAHLKCAEDVISALPLI
ncbi:MAG: histidine phosphatase family protein [Synergistaceae bacterium]|nr:histidine phosphatase family protein [Synergistaceae bacterium]